MKLNCRISIQLPYGHRHCPSPLHESEENDLTPRQTEREGPLVKFVMMRKSTFVAMMMMIVSFVLRKTPPPAQLCSSLSASNYLKRQSLMSIPTSKRYIFLSNNACPPSMVIHFIRNCRSIKYQQVMPWIISFFRLFWWHPTSNFLRSELWALRKC